MLDITYVDSDDEVIGSGPKKAALENGIAHRIVRIFIFNSAGQVVIQKRGPNVAVPGKWDQSAAGHVDAGETYDEAAVRELREELGLSGVALSPVGKFYSEEHDEALPKKRFNAVYFGKHDGDITIAADEVSEIAWVSMAELFEGANYTSGFSACLDTFEREIKAFADSCKSKTA